MTFDLKYQKYWPEDELIRYNKEVARREKLFIGLWEKWCRDFLLEFNRKAGENL